MHRSHVAAASRRIAMACLAVSRRFGRVRRPRRPRRGRGDFRGARDPQAAPADRQPQRPADGHPRERQAAAGCRGLRPRCAHRGRHRHRAAARGRRGRPVLVGVRPERARCRRARVLAYPARADRHCAAHHRALPARPRARAHRRRHRTRERGGPHRLAARHGRRPRDRQLARRPARLLAARRALHDAHALQHGRLGRFGNGRRAERRPLEVRRGSGAGDEPARDAGGHLPRVGRYHE